MIICSLKVIPVVSESLKIAIIICHYNIISSDIDECSEGSHDCEQECVNSQGSFTCSCHDGYEPLNNGKSCVGMYAHNIL